MRQLESPAGYMDKMFHNQSDTLTAPTLRSARHFLLQSCKLALFAYIHLAPLQVVGFVDIIVVLPCIVHEMNNQQQSLTDWA